MYYYFSKKGKKEGTVEVQEARIEIVPTFLDYIKVGKVGRVGRVGKVGKVGKVRGF